MKQGEATRYKRMLNHLIRRHTAASIMLSHGIPPIIVASMLGHSISILLTTYAHFIPTMQDQAAQLMDDILTPIPIELHDMN
jgi:integrase